VKALVNRVQRHPAASAVLHLALLLLVGLAAFASSGR